MTTSEIAYHEIHKMILAGELIPGKKVSQLKLARKFGCSTVPVVEAMRRLESEGLLVKEGRKMAIVRQLSLDELEGFYLVREALESVAAGLCAQRISESEVTHLKKLAEQFEVAGDMQHYDVLIRLEIEIHRCITENAGCPLLLEELNRLFLIETTVKATKNIKSPAEYRRSHRAIIEAIADGDADSAEYFMKRHIRDGYHKILQQAQGET